MWYSLTGNVLGCMMFKKGKTFLILWRKQTDETCTNYIFTSNFILIPFMKPELIFPFLTQLRALPVCGGSITCQGTD